MTSLGYGWLIWTNKTDQHQLLLLTIIRSCITCFIGDNKICTTQLSSKHSNCFAGSCALDHLLLVWQVSNQSDWEMKNVESDQLIDDNLEILASLSWLWLAVVVVWSYLRNCLQMIRSSCLTGRRSKWSSLMSDDPVPPVSAAYVNAEDVYE